jgi:hypothetical protein
MQHFEYEYEYRKEKAYNGTTQTLECLNYNCHIAATVQLRARQKYEPHNTAIWKKHF